MDQNIFYLIKDVGTPTFLVGVLTYGWYKLGVKMLHTVEKSNTIIEKNSNVIMMLIERLKQ